MKAKRIFEAYSRCGISQSLSPAISRFGGARSMLGNYAPYVYNVKSFNHMLEEKPSPNNEFNAVRYGDKVNGQQFKNNPDKTKYTGIVNGISKNRDGSIERVSISVKGKKIWLDPTTLTVLLDDSNSLANIDLLQVDDSMEFKDK
ncbi:MAG: hypothetical protein ACRDD8_11050 [Bacteroidales bacterium]